MRSIIPLLLSLTPLILRLRSSPKGMTRRAWGRQKPPRPSLLRPLPFLAPPFPRFPFPRRTLGLPRARSTEGLPAGWNDPFPVFLFFLFHFPPTHRPWVPKRSTFPRRFILHTPILCFRPTLILSSVALFRIGNAFHHKHRLLYLLHERNGTNIPSLA